MKKILKLTSLLAIIVFIALTGSVYAADIDCNVEITTAKNDFAKNEEFVANVEVKNINANPGIIAVSAVLEYDKNSLTLVSMSGKNSWDTPSYNDSNGKMVLTRANPSTTSEAMFEIKFKVNEGSVANPVITVKDIDLSNGDGKKNITSVSKTINVNGGTANSNNSNNNNNQGTTTDNSNNQSTTTTPEQNKPIYNDGNTKPDNKYDRTNITGNGKKPNNTDATTSSGESTGDSSTGTESTEITGTTTPVNTTPSTNTSSTSDSTVTTVKADGEMPKAGLSSFSMWLIIFTIVVVVVALVGYGVLMASDKRNNY